MWWMHRHNTQSTLLLSDHSIPSDVVLNMYKLCHPANFISFCECIYTVHSTQSTLLLSDHSIPSDDVLNTYKLCHPANFISFCECIYTVHSTQSTLLLSGQSISSTVDLNDKLSQPAQWYYFVNASPQYTVNPPTVWPFNVIHGGFDW